MSESDYLKYRGKCKELSEQYIADHPNSGARLVRGHYFCPEWGEQAHWWVEEEGKVVDVTKDQFPSKGMGIYAEFDGNCECDECGKPVKEEDARFDSRYVFCSLECNMKFVGL